MFRLTIDDHQMHVFIQGKHEFTLDLADYPELDEAQTLAMRVVSNYRTPEQEKIDMLTSLAMETDPLAVAQTLPEYQVGAYYRTGQHLILSGRIYRVLTAHISQADWRPDEVPALYTLANKTKLDPNDEVPDWKQPTAAHDAYNKGDLVSFNGNKYESLMDGNTYSPDEYPQGWKEADNG